ncbi:hypothetical protein RhiirB3_456490 [Rhizophagus irregularis]|nr:hypothetical protein RhiirB3_456490 [Rhizophagus irregularis]
MPCGLERIKGIYRQEVLKIENRNPKDRKAVGVVRTKVKDYNIYEDKLPDDAIASICELLSGI